MRILNYRTFVGLFLFVWTCAPLFGQSKDNESIILDYYNQSKSYASKTNSFQALDSALVYYEKAHKSWKKLGNKEKKKIAKVNIDDQTLRKLKNKIRSSMLEWVYSNKSLKSAEVFSQRFSRLPSKAQEAFLVMRNQLVLEEANNLEEFEAVDSLFKQYESDLKYYNPELTAQFDSLIYTRYFQKYNPENLYHLLYFIHKFPQFGSKVDEQLALVFKRFPYVAIVEKYILGSSSGPAYPKTAAAIYPYYKAWGKTGDLVEFRRKYPEFAQSQSFASTFNRMQQAQYKLVSGHETHLSDYIEITAPSYAAFTALQEMIAKDLENQQWEEALKKVRAHLPYFQNDTTLVQDLISILSRPEESVKKSPFDSTHINTTLQEYAPVVSSDGSKVFFCRRGSSPEDIYTAIKKNGKWSKAFPITSINKANYNEAPLAISGDGHMLLLFEEGVVKQSQLSVEGWTPPVDFFPSHLQSEWQGGTSISSDKNIVVFSARRPDRVGLPKNPIGNRRGEDENNDLYVSVKKPDGSWEYPINLGLMINTPFEERSPFLHPDMRTLYFSSNGHGGLGGLDVFKTTRIGDGWTNWTKPVNLGKFINAPGRDWGYRISTDGAYAYFSAEVEGKQSELFYLELPQAYRPEMVSIIQGKLIDSKTRPIDGKIIIEDLERDSFIAEIIPKPVTGEYHLTLPKGRLYSYRVEAENFFPVGGHIDLRDSNPIQFDTFDIKTYSIETLDKDSVHIQIDNLFFDHDQAIIKKESYNQLNYIAAFLIKNPIPIEIAGHTDDTGTPAYNLDLSDRRAQAVKKYLIQQGFPAEFIYSKGYGMTQPATQNDSDRGRAQNRRVEIRFKPNFSDSE